MARNMGAGRAVNLKGNNVKRSLKDSIELFKIHSPVAKRQVRMTALLESLAY